MRNLTKQSLFLEDPALYLSALVMLSGSETSHPISIQ
jgi:hypothetical protein